MSRPAWTLAEASQQTGVSVSTLRRALRSDRIDGAYKDSSGAWRLPVEGLLAAGYPPRVGASNPHEPPNAAPAGGAESSVHARLSELEAALRVARAERDAAREVAHAHERRADSAERALRLLEAPVQRPSTDHVQDGQMATADHGQNASHQLTGRSDEHPTPSTEPVHDPSKGAQQEPPRRRWWTWLSGQ